MREALEFILLCCGNTKNTSDILIVMTKGPDLSADQGYFAVVVQDI